MKGILIDDNGDLMTHNGSVVIGDVDSQVIGHVLVAYPGEFKEAPMVGAHIRGMLGGSPDPFWKNNTKDMLKTQHITIKKIDITDGQIIVEQ